jgi:hypothetical protein
MPIRFAYIDFALRVLNGEDPWEIAGLERPAGAGEHEAARREILSLCYDIVCQYVPSLRKRYGQEKWAQKLLAKPSCIGTRLFGRLTVSCSSLAHTCRIDAHMRALYSLPNSL